MPNHTDTLIKIKGRTEALAAFVARYILKDSGGDKYLDFNSIIPEPATKKDCPARYVIKDAEDAKRHHLGWDEKDPRRWFNWYEWHIDFWETKWNSYYGHCEEPEDIIDNNLEEIDINLNTAWSPAIPIYRKLQEMFAGELEIDVYYSDEGGSYVGHLHSDGEDECYEGVDYGEPGPREICDMLGNDWLYKDFDDEEEVEEDGE